MVFVEIISQAFTKSRKEKNIIFPALSQDSFNIEPFRQRNDLLKVAVAVFPCRFRFHLFHASPQAFSTFSFTHISPQPLYVMWFLFN